MELRAGVFSGKSRGGSSVEFDRSIRRRPLYDYTKLPAEKGLYMALAVMAAHVASSVFCGCQLIVLGLKPLNGTGRGEARGAASSGGGWGRASGRALALSVWQ